MNRKKSVLVTGATGLIGSHIVDELMKTDNAHVIALSHNKSKLEKVFGKYIGSDLFEYVDKDMGNHFDLASISQKYPIDVILHAASPISGKIVNTRPVDVIRPNLIALESLFEGLAAQKSKTGVNGRIVIFSSATVYGVSPQRDINVSEPDTQSSDSLDSAGAAYSESKRMAEVMARAYVKQYGADAVIARFGWVYGAASYPPETALFEFINNAIRREDIRFKSSGQPKRDNIYIDDAVSGLFTVAEKGAAGEAYNISSGGELGNFAAIDEIAEIIAETSGKELSNKISVIYESPAAGQPRKPGVLMKNDKLKALGWELKTSLADGIRAVLLEQSGAK